QKSWGKTTMAAGIAASFTKRGLTVQAFKKGPDYIDAMWLALATGRPCHNLDFNTMTEREILAVFAARGSGADVSIIEGNKGLFDGLDLDGGNSNAALVKLLQVPVVLVLDARGMTRGIAPLILGYQAFDPDIRIAGVILNKIGGSRHEAKLRSIIEHYTDVKVLGSVNRQPALDISERHLGLIPSNEAADARAVISAIADVIAQEVDLDLITGAAATAPTLPAPPPPAPARAAADVRIAIARDQAFGFYYPDDLEALEAAGAELVPFDTLVDDRLPDADGLFIGGGFPESHLVALESNVALRTSIRDAIEAGLPAYAECGGLMYLARTLSWRGERRKMVGVIPADAVMHPTPQGRGYVRLRETGAGPWPLRSDAGSGADMAAHEFHYASLENLTGDPVYAFEVLRGAGIDGRHDGIVHKNLLAGFAHLRDVEANRWAGRFVDFVRTCKRRGVYRRPIGDSGGQKTAGRRAAHLPDQVSRVYLVGAGPGDPSLLTVRGRQLIDEADIVVYDRLVSKEILDSIPPGTTRIFAGKAARDHFMPQEEVNELLVRLAESGRRVVRLKGGDPFIFGRGSEEASHLVEHGISFEVVPGVTAAMGCAARSGIPLTHRGVSQSVTFVTGHRQDGKDLDLNWKSLAHTEQTLIIYMGLANIEQISRELIAAGLPGYTPAAAIEKGTTPEQRTVITTVADLPDCVKTENLEAPTLLVIGEVVKFSESLSWACTAVGCDLEAYG
ncbi:MAG: cobyrinate a,c-diamide synthase, partial [Proteobacteria bacterium]|nr:cobyrinate a,c-diamide synthase [Pseudomonadota bacterium]